MSNSDEMEQTEEFDEPVADETSDQEEVYDEESGELADFADPSEGGGDDVGEESAEMGPEDVGDDLEVDESMIEMVGAIEQQMAQMIAAANEGNSYAIEDLEGTGNIVGVGISDGADAEDLDLDPGTPVVQVYVAEPTSLDDLKSVLVDDMGIEAAAAADAPVNVEVVGEIDSFSHRFKIRPAPGGVSIGHCRVTAGTLGCLARGQSGNRRRRVLLLSNNHVIANSNNARFGDPIIQPGRYDRGRCPADRIAILERFVRIRFGGPANYVDAATGWCWSNRVRRELIYRSGRSLRLFRISSRVRSCSRGMRVGKTGRTTQLTRGTITDCRASVRVNYGGGRVALFRDQVIVRGAGSRPFSAGGDSGSVIWTWDRRRNPVGLLFAGNGQITIANKMTRVVRALGINLYT
jgi:hypothetical protein